MNHSNTNVRWQFAPLGSFALYFIILKILSFDYITSRIPSVIAQNVKVPAIVRLVLRGLGPVHTQSHEYYHMPEARLDSIHQILLNISSQVQTSEFAKLYNAHCGARGLYGHEFDVMVSKTVKLCDELREIDNVHDLIIALIREVTLVSQYVQGQVVDISDLNAFAKRMECPNRAMGPRDFWLDKSAGKINGPMFDKA